MHSVDTPQQHIFAARFRSFAERKCGWRNVGGTMVVMMLATAVSLAAGCHRKSRLEVAPVHGKVTYQGRGVPKATVVFIPTGETTEKLHKIQPFCFAEDDGSFKLKTYLDGDGAPPGTYRVRIVVVPSGPAGRPGKDDPATSGAGAPAVNVPADMIKKYSDDKTSGIEVTVQAGDNELPPFELK